MCLQCGRLGSDPWVGKIPWRRAWQPTPIFLPGESHGERSLVDYTPKGCKESDMTEWLSTQHIAQYLIIICNIYKKNTHTHTHICVCGFPGGPMVSNPTTMQEIWIQFLGQNDPPEKKTTTHSSVLAWEIPWTEKARGYSPWGCKSRTWLSN